jgi:ABC-type transport system involved in multi-copper enzyme maturation permease subunit
MLNGIKTVFKKKYSKLVFSLSASTFFIFLVAVYVSTKPELKILSELVRLLKSDAELFKTFYANGFLIFMLIILSIFSGADLISADLKFKAFPLYFARPLSRADYLVGKFAIILFYLLLFTLVPGILLLLFKMLFTGSLAVSPLLLLAVLVFPLIACVFLAALTLALSILSSNTKFIQIAIFLVYMFSNNLAQMLHTIFKSDYFFLLSLPGNIQQLGSFLFGVKPVYGYPAWLSLLLPIVFSALAIWLLAWRIRKAEASS